MKFNRATLGDMGTATGNLVLSGTGIINIDTYLSVGNAGHGTLEINGGAINADRLNAGSQAGSLGTVALKGGKLNLASYINLGQLGQADFIIEGDAAKMHCNNLTVGPTSELHFILNGSSGVGMGCEIYDGNATLYGLVDASFKSGTTKGGSYLAISTTGKIVDSCTPGILTSSSISNGWQSEIASASPGQITADLSRKWK
jgi:T5SS/PEP-CTERM-associated repeat protein